MRRSTPRASREGLEKRYAIGPRRHGASAKGRMPQRKQKQQGGGRTSYFLRSWGSAIQTAKRNCRDTSFGKSLATRNTERNWQQVVLQAPMVLHATSRGTSKASYEGGGRGGI